MQCSVGDGDVEHVILKQPLSWKLDGFATVNVLCLVKAGAVMINRLNILTVFHIPAYRVC